MKEFPIPYVLKCIHFIQSSPIRNKRIVRNYEFDLYVGGKRDAYLDDTYYCLTEGSLVFRKPGQRCAGEGEMNMYLLTLDFSHTLPHDLPSFRVDQSPQQPVCDFELLEKIPPVFTPYHQAELKELYEKLFSCSYPNLVDEELQRTYVTELLLLILSDACRYNRQHSQLRSAGNPYIQKACNYINRQYSEEVSLEKVATYLSINKNYLIKLFKKERNTTPNQYLMEVRLSRALNLLLQSETSVQEIAQACGFSTTSYFIKCFKRRFGKTPLQYREDLQKEG